MPIDWAATGDWMQAWAGFAGAGAIVYAAYVGTNTYQTWLRQKQTERKMDAAEQVLRVSHNVKSAISGVRSPFISGGELHIAEEKLKKEDAEGFALLSEARRKNCITAQAVINRYVQNVPVWEELDATISLAYALLGDNVEQALKSLARQVRAVRVAADTYAELTGHDDPDFSKQVRRDLFENIGTEPKDDKIATAVAEAITSIETVVRPILRSEE